MDLCTTFRLHLGVQDMCYAILGAPKKGWFIAGHDQHTDGRRFSNFEYAILVLKMSVRSDVDSNPLTPQHMHADTFCL